MRASRTLAPTVGGRVSWLAWTLCALAITFIPTLGGWSYAQVCGDADGSGAVTVTDGVQTLRAAAGLSSGCTIAVCDVNGSGDVTVTDGVQVLRAAADLPVALACVPGASNLELRSFGTISLDALTESQTFEIDTGDATSLTIIADGGLTPRVALTYLEFPSGPVVLEPLGVPPAFRVDASNGIGVATIPQSPELPFEQGRYRFRIASSSAATISVSTIVNRRFPSAGRLNLRFFLVAIPGLTAASAPTDPTFVALLDSVRQRFAAAGITLGTTSVQDVPADQAAHLTLIDPTLDTNGNGQPDQMDELFAIPRDVSVPVVDVFFVQQFMGNILGIDGNIPGVSLVGPTIASGTVVATFTGFPAARRDVDAIAQTTLHEVGHYLGLYHTTERTGLVTDPLLDTPFCDPSTIVNSPDLCPDVSNVMFYAQLDAPEQGSVTSEQQYVMQRNPAVIQ